MIGKYVKKVLLDKVIIIRFWRPIFKGYPALKVKICQLKVYLVRY